LPAIFVLLNIVMRLALLSFLLFQFLFTKAGTVTGLVVDEKGKPLPYASILVKGTSKGTTANNEGRYFLQLAAGNYIIVCQYVGYERKEQTINLTADDVKLNFNLIPQQLSLAEVIVKPGAEDPAYEIIRNAIKKRPEYLNQFNKFQCEVYSKGQLRLRSYPKKIFGQKVDFEDGDTSRKKILYLSETIARYSVQKPARSKIEVISTKVSGQRNGFGLSTPQIISFYENNIQIGENLNPRGFISPIANNALNFYRYKYEGSFIEDGREINRIKVIGKRKFEPVFNGYIFITENDWRIHSVQLQLTKQSQMQLVDTLNIDQLYVPLDDNVWTIKTQVIYPAIKILGFDAYGSFVNVYSKFDVDPVFAAKFFNNTYLKFEEGSNKKPAQYWDTIRPLPLQFDEVRDYKKKDSLEQVRKSPRYLDSLDRVRNKLNVTNILLLGQTFSNEKKRENINVAPLTRAVSFNTVEGWVFYPQVTYSKRLDSINPRKSFFISTDLRYGFTNKHFNSYISASYNFGKKYLSTITVAGGKKVFQFNNNNPISPSGNRTATLLFERNYMKLYEAWAGHINFSKGLGEGVTVYAGFNYQNRLPLENTAHHIIRNYKNRQYTPNYPTELANTNIQQHQAGIFSAGINWRPGARYIEFPDRKINIGSKYPTFSLLAVRAVSGLLGSDVDYGKWRFGVSDDTNLKLLGSFRYIVAIGGFFNSNKVQLPDLKHFNGNQLILAANYLNSFQLLPYYKFSNAATLYGELHAAHHFNGLLTNKIPVFRKLNWHLIGGANAFYINNKTHYTEAFAGLENIFRIARVDWLWGFEYGRAATTGIRISVNGFTGNGGADD
jgi:Family of unknown function (DUF5686)/CarboxypepD_reg-like domain